MFADPVLLTEASSSSSSSPVEKRETPKLKRRKYTAMAASSKIICRVTVSGLIRAPLSLLFSIAFLAASSVLSSPEVAAVPKAEGLDNSLTNQLESKKDDNTKIPSASSKATEVQVVGDGSAASSLPTIPLNARSETSGGRSSQTDANSQSDEVPPRGWASQAWNSWTDSEYYLPKKKVKVLVNKVWPTGNPLDTYRYYDQPLACAPEIVYPQFMSLGQILRGDRLMNSLYDFEFNPQKPVERKVVCERHLSKEDVEQIKTMIDEYYAVELYVGELPIQFYLGVRLRKETYDAIAEANGGIYSLLYYGSFDVIVIALSMRWGL